MCKSKNAGGAPQKNKKLGHHARTRKAPYNSITYNLRAFPAFESCVRVESNEVEYTKSTKTTKVQQFRYISPSRLKRALSVLSADERHTVEPCAGGLQGKRMKIETYEFWNICCSLSPKPPFFSSPNAATFLSARQRMVSYSPTQGTGVVCASHSKSRIRGITT